MDRNTKSAHRLKAVKKLRHTNTGMTEEVHYPLFYEGVPSEFEKYAEVNLNETKANATKGMKALKEFLKDNNIKDVDESIMVMVLRTCKYDIKKAIKKLDNFLKARRLFFENLAELDLKKVEYILQDQSFSFFPHRDKYGRIIIFTQPTANLECYDVDEFSTCVFATLLYLLNFQMTSLFGLVLIGDCKIPSMAYCYKTLLLYKKFVMKWLFLPTLMKRVDLINENFLARWIFNVLRPFLPSKIVQRITFHGSNLQTLQEFYHPDLLPEECGGNMGPLSTDFYKEELIDFIKKLKAEHCQIN